MHLESMAAIAIGAIVTLVCFTAIEIKGKLGYDDSLDAFGVHGVGGATGALLTGVFASKLINPAGNDGLLAGNAALLGTQAVSVVVTVAYAAVMTFILLKVIGAVTKIKMTDEEQSDGMDLVLHNEVGYRM